MHTLRELICATKVIGNRVVALLIAGCPFFMFAACSVVVAIPQSQAQATPAATSPAIQLQNQPAWILKDGLFSPIWRRPAT